MLSEAAQSVLTFMQQQPTWVIRIDQQTGYTFDLGRADASAALAHLPVAVFDELRTAGLIQRKKAQPLADGRFLLCQYQVLAARPE